jgi:hypothetical protein
MAANWHRQLIHNLDVKSVGCPRAETGLPIGLFNAGYLHRSALNRNRDFTDK